MIVKSFYNILLFQNIHPLTVSPNPGYKKAILRKWRSFHQCSYCHTVQCQQQWKQVKWILPISSSLIFYFFIFSFSDSWCSYRLLSQPSWLWSFWSKNVSTTNTDSLKCRLLSSFKCEWICLIHKEPNHSFMCWQIVLISTSSDNSVWS